MKITKLVLENFIPILAGMGKYKIEIDLSASDKLITVLIGKIGSGKTYVLSHLQPFPTVGTLDVRNSDDPIIPEKDGYKEIVYEHNGSEYVIKHYYQWGKTSHSKKSYCAKNGTELNPNGNQTLFQSIIQEEFGIDPGFLRLIRLGPNVVNFINMTAAERKTYIASLLKDTEMYLMLHKHWKAELRTINAQIALTTNKLSAYGLNKLDEMEEEVALRTETISEITERINDMKERRMAATAEIRSILGDENSTLEKFDQYENECKQQLLAATDQRETLEKKIHQFDSYLSNPEEIMKEMGRADAKYNMDRTRREELQQKLERQSGRLDQLIDQQAISSNQDHMDMLRSSYDDMKNQSYQLEQELKGFHCNQTKIAVEQLIPVLHSMDGLLNELREYNKDFVQQILHSDSSILKWAKDKLEVLQRTRIARQRTLSNLKFSGDYVPPELLFRPPFCPTKDCPYFHSHPRTIQKRNKKKDAREARIRQLEEEIQGLDVEIYKYEEVPTIYSKIQQLRSFWNGIVKPMNEIHCINVNSIDELLIHTPVTWYSYNKIVDTIDLIRKREVYYELLEKMKGVHAEISKLESQESASLEKEIADLTDRKNETYEELVQCERACSEDKEDLEKWSKIYEELSKKAEYDRQFEEISKVESEWNAKVEKCAKDRERMKSHVSEIQRLNIDLEMTTKDLDTNIQKKDLLQVKINDMKFAKSELDKALQEKQWMDAMVTAVSSKEGIPLIMIKAFFESCRDSINEMLYKISGDDFFLLPFEINEKEFFIPYCINNGTVANDISKASQGQTSVVSTAMSFAIVKELGATLYNIPLLDEMDAPLHKDDKQKFIAILFEFLHDIQSEQCFVITHDESVFDTQPVQVIATTDETVNETRYSDIIRLSETPEEED